MTSDIKSIIECTVNSTVAKLKLSGLMKDNRQTAFQKTEEILRNYNELKNSYSENGTAEKFVKIVDKGLAQILDDTYYDIIPMLYFEGQSREAIAEHFDTTVTTISRNKRRLINKLKYVIFADDSVFELFL